MKKQDKKQSKRVKYGWIPTAACIFPPDAIQLGQLVSDPTQPHQPLWLKQDAVVTLDTPIHSATDQPFNATSERQKQFKTGLRESPFAAWAALIPGSILNPALLLAELGLEWSREWKDDYSFKVMHRRWFEPSDTFVKSLLARSEVREFLEDRNYKKPLYMVTGVMVGEDGESFRTKSNKLLGGLPGFSGHNMVEEGEVFVVPTPTVLAFKLCKINVKPFNAEPQMTEYVKGAQWR